ncbi:unnamed protein product [Calicophoron daubneyi]|uniref:Agrin n=1 Tax=Calicophoron daubneyi TaxID=300641 RepID=A0AAV2TWE8_CALDB
MMIDISVKYRGKCASNPCLGHTCRWPGEHCQVDTHGQPNCVCPDPCPRVIAPVCGSDGVTYDNHCELERTACLKMREIWVVYAGQCSAEPQCQALGLQCQGYEVCSEIVAPQIYGQLQQYPSGSYQNDLVPRQQQMVTRCLCPVCPEQGLGSQVCGTDGQTYRSECHLRASACQRQLDDLKVSSRGPCDSCKTKQCKFYSICQLNSLGEPECICPTGCLYVRKPVCGTDGKMYENECFLKVKACADQKEIHVAQEGHCKRCLYDCPLGYQCRNGECVCRDSCPKPNPLESEICGDDGKLYPSECELKRAACMQGKSIKIDLSGSCHRPRNAGKVFDLEGVPQADEVNLQVCKCNKYGALSEYCDKLGLCHCKWGATGRLCDKCVPGYWGLENGHQCIDCSCHRRGSLNTTCDQKTGQCICRPGIHGRQCSICPDGGQVTERGCLKDGTGPAEPEHREIPSGSQTPVADREHPENIPTSGRRFTPQTTLLVRAPFFLTMPTVLRLIVSLSSLDGNLLHCYVSPSKQESLTIENMRDHQISLSLIGGHVEFEYTDGRYLDRTFTVQTADKVQLNTPQIILAGISNGNPWVQLNYRPKTNSIDVKTKWISPDSSHQDELPSTGGRGTIMVGRRVVRYRDRNSNTLLGKEHPGIVGCLLQLRIEAGTPLERRDFDLLGGDMSEIAWLGVQQNEAPVCRVPEQTKAASIQSDSNQQHTMMTSKWEEDIVTEDRCTTEHPCRNGGTCVASKGNSYECICPPGWQGEECTQVATVIPEFNGNSFIRLPGPRGRQSMKHKRLRLELVFLATKAPGLLFYIPPSRSGAAVNPFIAAYIDQKGYLMVVCRVGIRQQQSVEDTLEQRSHVIFLRYPIPLKTNRWNVLTIDKRRKIMDVSVNGKTQQSIRLTPPQFEMLPRRSRRALTAFDLSSSPIYLGGYAGEDKHPFSLDVSVGFSGAIQKIKVNQAEVVLAGTPAPKAASYEYWSNVTQWQGPPCGPKYSPCAVDSLNHVCRPHGSQALCACSTPQQLWQILHERGDRNIDEAEKRACENRQAELNELSSDQKNDQSNDYMDEQDYQDIQYDGLPKPRSSIQQKPYEKPTSSGNSAKCGPLSVKFEGKTVFEFRGLVQSPNAYNVRLSLRTTSQDGLILLLINEDVSESSSYVQRQQGMGDQVELTILAMRKGRVEFSIIVAPRPVSTYETDYSRIVYSGAVSPLQLQAETRVNDGKCHSVHAVRSHRRVTLIIDNYMVFGEFLGNRIWSRSRNSAFLGGSMLNITSLPWEYQRNFTGCIAELYANEQQVGMLTSPVSIRGPLSSC